MPSYYYIKYIFFIILIVTQSAYAEQSFYLYADKVIKDDKKELIQAQGNVEIQSGKIKARSDLLQFDTKKNQIILEGNIKILDEQGNVVFAEKAILDKKLKEGIINKLGLLMSDESRLVASSAQKDSKKYKTVYKNISYSRCKNCENNKKSTFWKLNAKKATHLEKSKVILYEDVFLEVLSFPLLYFPFFYHPDPTVTRKTGLLAPSLSKSNVFGISYKQPLFLNLSPTSDLTLETKLTQKEGILLKKNYRKNFSTGQLQFKSSVTRGTKVRVDEPTKKENRGHVDFNYANHLGNNFLAGINFKRASDKSYLSRYELTDGEALLTQNIYLEKENPFNSFSTQFFKFQTLSDIYLEDNLPFIRPVINYSWNNLNKKKRIRNWSSNLKFRSVSKKNNTNVNAAYYTQSSEKSFLVNNILLKNGLDLTLDYYSTKYNTESYENNLRFYPSISLTASYPMIKFNEKSSILFEPITKIIYTADNNDNEKIKNQDSMDVELMSSNFLIKDKYSGDDRNEVGLRANYGFSINFNGIDGSSNNLVLGRSYLDTKQDKFDYISGFSEKNSDFVGNYTVSLPNENQLYYDFRVSENLDLNRNRLKTKLVLEDNVINVNYIQIKNFASRNNPDTEQISYGLERKFFKNWKLNFSQHRDLAGAKFSNPFKSSAGLVFENDCAIISINVTRNKSYDIDIPSTTNYNFNINLF